MHKVIFICLTGDDGRGAAKEMCANLQTAIEEYSAYPHDFEFVLKALFETQPFIALDTFLLSTPTCWNRFLFRVDFPRETPIDSVECRILKDWADRDPCVRYPLLGRCLRMFDLGSNEERGECSPRFLEMLAHAPDKRLFLGEFDDRLRPRSWSGSLAMILTDRKAKLMKLATHDNEQVRAWVAEGMPGLDRLIQEERGLRRGVAREESFE